MIDYFSKLFSPQATNIYRLLLDERSLTAKEIADELHIFPNAVYRAIKRLIDSGFIHQTGNYPVRYEALSESEALELYSLALRQNYKKTFHTKRILNCSKVLDISFIRNREYLRENTDNDMKMAKKEVNFIVSGLEVPAETVLVYKQAVDRGVIIRALVQRLDDTSEEMFRNWEKIGVKVKHYPNMEARTFIIDQTIVYFTSYSPQYKEGAIGMRFNYAPYAKLMNELFEQRWKVAKNI